MRSRGLVVGFSVALGAVLLISAADADAQRRRRRRRAQRQSPGTLVIQSQMEGAEVLVDEETVGFTPLDPVSLSAGSHTIRVRRPGYTEFTDVIDVEPGQRIELPIDLMALAMVLTVRSDPDEARVFVDGTFRGNTPIELELIEGEHSIRVTAPRYHEQLRTITAAAGQIDAIDVELEPLPEDLLTARTPEWYEEPVTWIAVGAGALAVAIIIVVTAVVLSEPDRHQIVCGADLSECHRVMPWPME